MSSTLSPHIPTSWFNPIGIKKVLKRFWHRLPDVNGSLFITLTINPQLFQDETSAFDHARDKIRRMFYSLRNGVKWNGKEFKLNAPYAFKLEFHENGWPHFHIIFRTKRFLPHDLLSYLWNFGWTHVRRIKQEKFEYLLKYVTKAQSIPAWVLSRTRIRIFQSSKGFLKPEFYIPTLREQEKKQIKSTQNKQQTIGERMKKWTRMARFTTEEGYIKTFEFPCPFQSIFDHLILSVARDGRYMGNSKVRIENKNQVLLWTKTSKQIQAGQDFQSLESSYPIVQDCSIVKMERDHL